MKKRIFLLSTIFLIFLVASCEQVPVPGISNGDGAVKWSGVRVSSYGMRDSFGDDFPDVTKMCGFADKMSSYYEGSTGAYILIVGTMSGDDTCHLYFPVSGEYDCIEGSKNDKYEEYLTAFDKKGYSVWLQVEPGYADLTTLVKLVMDRYGHHKCVKGFGIDVEWYRPVEGSDKGSKLSNSIAKKVLNTVRGYDSSYTVFVKHWMKSYLPSSMEGLIYVNDSQQFGSLEDVREDFADWAAHYAPNPVMFQIGYKADRWIWSEFSNPAKELGQYIVDGCTSGNDIGVMWVDFTLNEVL